MSNIGWLLCLAPQQFIEARNVFPGPELWTEAGVLLDANEDGAWDVLFVNANGYAAPSGDPLPPTLMVQTGHAAGVASFEDRTATLLPSSLRLHGKGAAVADLDGDGHQEIVFAAAYGAQQPLVRKTSSAGPYLDETFRLPSLVLNSFSVQAGDLDDDGDLDLVFADSGEFAWAEPGGRARLLLNRGDGTFHDAPAQLGAALKVGAQNIKFVDLDLDLDVDVVVDGKSPHTQLYINDGRANFRLDQEIFPAANVPTQLSTYETEWADMDGDLDVDALLMNQEAVFVDAAVQNRLVETGRLGFQSSTAAFAGPNSDDENDFAFLDADDDGDLDVIVATLAPSSEKLFLNRGPLSNGDWGSGFLSYVEGAFSSGPDATLDATIADFDGDGRYDVVTSQGEFGASYANRYYRNAGPMDTQAPRITQTTRTPAAISLGLLAQRLPVRAAIVDSVVDDNVTFVKARLSWTVTHSGSTIQYSADMPHVGGGIHRGMLVLAGSVAVGDRVGLRIDPAHVHLFDAQGNRTAA